MSADGLVCPGCGATAPARERFCSRCGMPLVHAQGARAAVSERHERARKVKPQYTEGELVRVASARNQAEAELIAGLLLEEGIPSVLRRTRGFDVPDMLAAGPRDVVVAASGAAAARQVLLEAELVEDSPGDGAGAGAGVRVLAGLLAAVAVVALIAWVGTALGG